MLSQLLLASLLPLASAHFKLTYPAARGFDEDILGTFPCGGQDTVSSNRTSWPITGAPIQLYMGHTSAKVQVLLGLGNDPGSNFNITLMPTFQEEGPDNFCINGAAIHIPADALSLISEGTNATIQVVTNGDPNGGLYNVRFFSSLRSNGHTAHNLILTLSLPVRRHHLHRSRPQHRAIQRRLPEQHRRHRVLPEQRRQRKRQHLGRHILEHHQRGRIGSLQHRLRCLDCFDWCC